MYGLQIFSRLVTLRKALGAVVGMTWLITAYGKAMPLLTYVVSRGLCVRVSFSIVIPVIRLPLCMPL